MFSPIIPGVCYARNRLHLCIWNYFYLECLPKPVPFHLLNYLPIHSPYKTQPSHCFLWETFPISLRLWFYHQYLAHCLGQSWFLINAYWKNKWMSGLMDGFLPSLNWLSWAFESWVLRLEVTSEVTFYILKHLGLWVYFVNQSHWKWIFASSKSFPTYFQRRSFHCEIHWVREKLYWIVFF